MTYTLVNSAFRRMRQEGIKFEASLGYVVRPYPKKKKKGGQRIKINIIGFLQQNHPLAVNVTPALHRAVSSDLEKEGGFCLYLQLSSAELKAWGIEMEKGRKHLNKQDVPWHSHHLHSWPLPKERVKKASSSGYRTQTRTIKPQKHISIKERTRLFLKTKQANKKTPEAGAGILQGPHRHELTGQLNHWDALALLDSEGCFFLLRGLPAMSILDFPLLQPCWFKLNLIITHAYINILYIIEY